MSAAGSAVRRVQVTPPSMRGELGEVVRIGMMIVIGSVMYLATDSAAFRETGSPARQLLPFQALVQDRPAIEQRMFRELQEGLLEAEARRASSGSWPAVATLEGEGIPPFALDPTARGGPYQWRVTTSGTFVNYLGQPQRPEAPAWLVLIQEPTPGAAPDPAREDEEHHKLPNGDMLHVSTWLRADSRTVTGQIVRTPQSEGWTQLYAVAPSIGQITVRPPAVAP